MVSARDELHRQLTQLYIYLTIFRTVLPEQREAREQPKDDEQVQNLKELTEFLHRVTAEKKKVIMTDHTTRQMNQKPI